MENNIIKNAINYLAQSLSITPEQLIDAYAAQGQAFMYMVLLLVGVFVVLLVCVIFCIFTAHQNEITDIVSVCGSISALVLFAIILMLAYDVFLWMSDPRAYARHELIRDIKLWK